MNCNCTEKVSLLIDGELTREEAEQVKLHISSCLICWQAQEEFLSLREEIKSHPYEHDLSAERRAINSILISERSPLWQRRVVMPAPVFSLMVLALFALLAWSVYTGATRPARSQGRVQPASVPVDRQAQGGFDLSRFDRGERAVIYTARRAQPGNTLQ